MGMSYGRPCAVISATCDRIGTLMWSELVGSQSILARHGVATLVAAISPLREARERVRAAALAEGTPFVEVYVRAPPSTLVARDPKGLYARALAGTLPHFTGISDPYEAQESPDLELWTNSLDIFCRLNRET